MGFMQVYRVGDTSGDSPMGKISRLLTGEGIDTDDLGDRQPESGCVLIDLMAGEDNVKKIAAAVPQLPQILVTSTEALGSRQLGLTDEIVSPDIPDPEIVRRVDGRLVAESMGSGDIDVDEGDLKSIQVEIMGSADFDFGGAVGDAKLSTIGSGDINIARLTGHLKKRVMGSGDIDIADRADYSDYDD